jgi:hypothetical protein
MADKTSSSADDLGAVRALLNRMPALERPCDLDLLVFFARHWRILVSSEQLALLLGYPLREIARSRDVLVAAGLLTRAQEPTRAERMYVFDPESTNNGPLSAIVTLASTPGGRLSLRRALMSAPAGARNGVAGQAASQGPAREARPLDHASPERSRFRDRHSNEQPERTQ